MNQVKVDETKIINVNHMLKPKLKVINEDDLPLDLDPHTLSRRYYCKNFRVNKKVFKAIRLWVLGYSIAEASKMSGISEMVLRRAIRTPEGQKEIEIARRELEDEFLNLQHKVNEVLKHGLDHPDPQVALASASMWLKSTKGRKMEIQLTAEDVVRKLIEESSSGAPPPANPIFDLKGIDDPGNKDDEDD